MRLRRLRPWLLLAAVLMGQWLALAHASEHTLLQSDVSCGYCISGVGSAPLPSAAASAPAPAPLLHAPQWSAVATVIRPLLGPRSIRGPPLLVS